MGPKAEQPNQFTRLVTYQNRSGSRNLRKGEAPERGSAKRHLYSKRRILSVFHKSVPKLRTKWGKGAFLDTAVSPKITLLAWARVSCEDLFWLLA